MTLTPPFALYLDHQATTPLDARVLDAMMRCLASRNGNPSSNHPWGWKARKALEESRNVVAQFVDCDAERLVFCSGATEANHLAIVGAMRARMSKGHSVHVISQKTEHMSVLSALTLLQEESLQVTLLDVDRMGCVDPDNVRGAMREDTALVSIMAVNNEIGAVQPIAAIGKICREATALFHVDGVQAAAWMPLGLKTMHIDFLSLSAHKIYGPPGIGALAVSARGWQALRATTPGGGQEFGMRGGTPFVAGALGFAEACRQVETNREEDVVRLLRVSAHFWQHLNSAHEFTWLGPPLDRHHRHPGNIAFLYPGCDMAEVMLDLPHLAFSSGAACASAGKKRRSHVLAALGYRGDDTLGSARCSFGRGQTLEDAEVAACMLMAAVRRRKGNVGAA